MPDVRTMFDSRFIYAFHLAGKDATVTIAKVEAGEIIGDGGRKAKKPVVYFSGKDKGLALNKTNVKTIASMYGYEVRNWIGKRIVIYPTTTEMGGKIVECIRVRPERVDAKQQSAEPEPQVDDETGEVTDEENSVAAE